MEWIDFSLYAALIATFWFVFALRTPQFVLGMIAGRNLDWLTSNKDRAGALLRGRWLAGSRYFLWFCYAWGTLGLFALSAVQVDAVPQSILRFVHGGPKWEVLKDVNSAMFISGLLCYFACLGVALRRIRDEVPLAQRRHASLQPRSVGHFIPRWVRAGTYTVVAVHLAAWMVVGTLGLYPVPGFWVRFMAPIGYSAIFIVIARAMVMWRPSRLSNAAERRWGVRFAFAALVYVQVRFAIQLYGEIAGAPLGMDRLLHLGVVLCVLLMMLGSAPFSRGRQTDGAPSAGKSSLAALGILIVALLAPPSGLAQQTATPAGVWNGAISLPGAELVVSVNLQQKDDGGWSGTIDIPIQNAKGIPLANIAVDAGVISFSITGAPGNPTFKGALSEDADTISGDFTQGPGRFMFRLTRSQTGQAAALNRPQEPKPPFPYDALEVAFENKGAGIRLAGALTLPRSSTPAPAVVLISGSGPQDRDESIAGHKPFLVLADYLTRRGVAVLRVDDRGVGGSTGNTFNSTSEDFATDALAAVEYLKGRSEIHAGRIGLIGHSEGGLVAPLAATKSSDIAFIVLMAGPGLPGDQILYSQAAAMMKAGGAGDAAIDQNRRIQEEFINVVKSEKDPAVRDSSLRAVRDKAVAALADDAKPVAAQQLEAQLKMMSTAWFSHFVAYDPRPVLRNVKCPVLAMIGENDLQVPYRENLDEIEAALKSGGNTDYTIAALPGLNHLFQTSKTGLPSEYSQIEQTIAPRALDMIGEWIERRVR